MTLNNEGKITSIVRARGRLYAYVNSEQAEDVDATVSFELSRRGMPFGMLSRRADGDADTFYQAAISGSGLLSISTSIDGVVTNLAPVIFLGLKGSGHQRH